MATRRPKPHLVKKRFSYSTAEIAALQSVHRNTVRAWLKEGLPTISDNCRPILILGHDLADFLSKRRTRNKRACQPSQLYCLACRQPREPAGAMVDLTLQTPTRGMLAGIWPVCDRFMHRAVNPTRVRENCANLTVIETAATAHIGQERAKQLLANPRRQLASGAGLYKLLQCMSEDQLFGACKLVDKFILDR